MRQVIRYTCDLCGSEHWSPSMAENCETRCRDMRVERAKIKAEEEHWLAQGHDIWHERSGLQHALKVDPENFGSHEYGPDHGTSDCSFNCGCWMGPAASGGPVNPFGACPNNPTTVPRNGADGRVTDGRPAR